MTNNILYKKQCTIFNSLFEKNDIQGIVNIAESILRNPIFILDTSYHVISRSNQAKKINSSTENHNGSYYLIDNFIELMNTNKCIDSIYNTNSAFFFEDKNNNDKFIFCPIRICDVTAFYIVVIKNNTEFEDEHLELTNTLSKVLSIQIEKDNIFISNSGLDYEYYLTDLLLNRIDNIDYLKRRLNNINFNLKQYFALLCISYKQTTNDYKHNFALRELFKNIKNILINSIFTYYEGKIIFLITSDTCSVITKTEYKRLQKFLELNNLKCGVSIPFSNILEAPNFFVQAVFASSLSINDRIILFNNYIDFYLLSNCNKEIELSTIVHPYIKKLEEYDKKHNSELLNTLRIYLDNNRNVLTTSSLLNIHKSTFFYRFHKIEEVINSSLNTDNILFKLELSFKILDYIKLNSKL